MFSYLLSQLMYTKAVVLISTALLVLIWAVYFCTALAKRHGTFSLRQYRYYVCYTIGVFIWILSNSYFHTGLLLHFSNEVAVKMAIIANLATLLAFASAYCFIAKLHKHYTGRSVPHWQTVLVSAISIFGVACNLLPDWTVKNIEITAPSDFQLEFGPYTKYFFLGFTTLIVLTFTNLLSLKNSNSPIRRTRINYMILGITIFMCSTAIIQVGVTYFFEDFSMTWLPPALSLSEMLFMGYALLTSRFYSPRYICFVTLSVLITTLIYASLISIPFPFIEMTLTDVLLLALLVGMTWQTLYKTIQKGVSLILYGDSLCPVERIFRLEEEFQRSPAQAMESLANYLGVPKDKLRLLDDYQGANLYRAYFKDHSTALVIEEIEESLSQSGNHTLSLIHNNMNKTQSALVLPIYESKNNLSHVLVSSSKSEGVYFSFEELSALERVFQKVQVHINYEREIRQSQALASSIAHEMRNPFAQVQFQFEHLGSGINNNRPPEELVTHVNKGKQAIKRGHQLIDIIMREVGNASLAQEPVAPSSMSSVIVTAVNQYGFDDDSTRQRVHLDIEQDFIVKLNETLFNFVLFNLLRNAIYYFDSYPNSAITIRTLKGSDQNQVVFSDSGPGIPEAYLSQIFDDFFSHNKSGGSGLGLGYCKRVMKAFGGSIRCDSKVGEYTTFYLNFPVTSDKVDECQINGSVVTSGNVGTLPTLPPISELTPTTNPDKPLILVVDDKRVQLSLAKLYLEQLGYNVLLANNGKVAVETIQNNPIDLVFMDIQMPVMDGFEAATLIKRSHPSLPIIALSGESGEKELRRISELMDGRLSKPTSKQALNQILTSALPTTMQ
ncbi:hybrid sensor histidine kinase/response regulator [Vibrio coralliilyticus]|uniref:hybrid sensor histidine kinase/response regulator n=1 Tax=Vibrio coralliilyticus TaxID=190893 RepID=UPI0008103672|nr:response regulator [Vibrio coralliilyticus]ANW25419.1 hybrid sensor histidine kinase/response regulator [Vibrio coralliilyticus]